MYINLKNQMLGELIINNNNNNNNDLNVNCFKKKLTIYLVSIPFLKHIQSSCSTWSLSSSPSSQFSSLQSMTSSISCASLYYLHHSDNQQDLHC